jgi:hypothetical protein
MAFEGEVLVLQWCQSYCSCLHVVITLKIMVAKMILQNRRDGSLSMAYRGCTPVFQDFTRGRCRVVEWQGHCAAERCHVEVEQLSEVAQGAYCWWQVLMVPVPYSMRVQWLLLFTAYCLPRTDRYGPTTLCKQTSQPWTSSIAGAYEVPNYFLYFSPPVCGDEPMCPLQ